MPDDEESRSNLGLIYLISGQSYNVDFAYDPFIPGEDKETQYRIEVVDRNFPARAVVSFSDRRGNDSIAVYDYMPDSLDFNFDRDIHCTDPGTSSQNEIWIVNTGDKAKEIYGVHPYIGDPHFAFTAPSGGTFTIEPGDSAMINVEYTGNDQGVFSEALCMMSDQGDLAYIELQGLTDVKLLSADTYLLDLGTSMGAEILDSCFYLENSGCSNLLIKSVEHHVDMPGVFNIGPDLENLVIAPGDSYKVPISFSPKEIGYYTDTLIIKSNGDNFEDYSSDIQILITGNAAGISVEEDTDNAGFKLWPNPVRSSSTLNLQIGNDVMGRLSAGIYNMFGRRVADIQNISDAKGTLRLNLPELSTGAYLIEIRNGDNIYYEMLIVE